MENREWRRIRFGMVVMLTEEVPFRLRWRWKTVWKQKRKKLCLKSPRGKIWEFKLHHRAWLRPFYPGLVSKTNSPPALLATTNQ